LGSSIPYSRSDDVTREIDIIEEIGRLHGFNNFLTTLPKIKTIGNEDPSYETRKKITSSLLNLGFNELIHYWSMKQHFWIMKSN
jgi:phenylalanyl-tRNA synthetase beta chain